MSQGRSSVLQVYRNRNSPLNILFFFLNNTVHESFIQLLTKVEQKFIARKELASFKLEL